MYINGGELLARLSFNLIKPQERHGNIAGNSVKISAQYITARRWPQDKPHGYQNFCCVFNNC